MADIPRQEQEQLPPQLARVVLEKQALPEPGQTGARQNRPSRKSPEPPEQKPVEPVRTPPEQRTNVAKEQAEKAILEFRDELAAMRDSLDLEAVSSPALSRGQASAEQLDRSMITARAATRAGSIDTASLSRDVGGAALSGGETTRVSSPVQQARERGEQSASAERGGRGDDAIRRVMDANKGAIFAIYNRALRQDPTLQGKLVFEMVIEPSGQISALTLLSSELGDSSLTERILARLRLITFPAEPVRVTRVNYSLRLPAQLGRAGQLPAGLVTVAADQVVIDDTGRLQIGVDNGRTDEGEALLSQCLADLIGQGGSDRHLGHGVPVILYGFAIHKLPEKIIKGFALIVQGQQQRALLRAAAIFSRLRMMPGFCCSRASFCSLQRAIFCAEKSS